ncbi:MAG: hypothetical protein LC792_15355 [Actinobacteria bacterium]|nr:hypothetical protein [Actinomycetota bacterium]
MWKSNLDDIAQSGWARAAVANVGDRDAQVQAVTDALTKDAGFAGRGYRNGALRDGRVVGVDATHEDAIRDWANVIVDHVNAYVHAPDGTPLDSVISHLQDNRSGPMLPDLNAVPEHMRPMSVNGQDTVGVPMNRYQAMVRNGFAGIGKQMNYIAREPIFLHNYTVALDDARSRLGPLLGDGEGADAMIHQAAEQRAINATIPFIHDPQLRSEFAVATRNFMPFWFAQEQFLKRWAKTLVHSPEAFREAQLVMGGMRHSGMVHTDDQGNDYFMYPFMGAAQDVITKGLQAMGLGNWTLPIQAGFSGQVQYATPGLERLGSPSFGPLGAIPLTFLAKQFPELQPSTAAALGRGAGKSYWEQIAPPTIARIVHATIDRADSSPQMMSATIDAMRAMEAAGHGIPDLPADPTPEQIRQHNIATQEWQDRVKSWTRVLFFTRAALGFAAPSSPQIQLDPKNLNAEYQQVLNSGLSIDDAHKEFLRRHPDANAYTVFKSKAAGQAPLPATENTLKFMDDHAAFLRDYPDASAWFIPTGADNSKYSQNAYREQMALELRSRRNPDEWYRQLKYSEGADAYFDEKKAVDDLLKTTRGAAADDLRHRWDVEKQRLFTANPIFAEELQKSTGPADRAIALTNLRLAFEDPRVPVTPQTDVMRKLVDNYDGLTGLLAQTAGVRSGVASAQNKQYRQAFVDWAEQYTKDNPSAKPLYDRLIRLEVGG